MFLFGYQNSLLLVAVFIGEVANFVAYIYAPALLVTPLGALSIIVRYQCLRFLVINLNMLSHCDFLFKLAQSICALG